MFAGDDGFKLNDLGAGVSNASHSNGGGLQNIDSASSELSSVETLNSSQNISILQEKLAKVSNKTKRQRPEFSPSRKMSVNPKVEVAFTGGNV